MKFIIDASVIFSGFTVQGDNEYITTEKTLMEIRSSRFKKSLESMQYLLRIMQPGKESIDIVLAEAKNTGETGVLSRNDIELLALALENSGVLLTNDLAMQNIANRLGIKYESFNSKKISEVISWRYRCIGCHRTFKEFVPVCPNCGSPVKKVPSKKKKVQ